MGQGSMGTRRFRAFLKPADSPAASASVREVFERLAQIFIWKPAELWPRRLTRYVLFELLKTFAVTLVALTTMIIIVLVVTEGMRRNLGAAQLLLLTPYVLPVALRFAVPGTILFATCSVYGSMSAHNEVVALKSAGISPMAIFWPAIVLSFLLSLWALWLNDVAVSWGRIGTQRVVIEAVEDIAYSTLRAQKSYQAPNFSIVVKEVSGRQLVKPVLTIYGAGEPIVMQAESAELRGNPVENTLTVLLRDLFADMGTIKARDRETFRYVFSLSESVERKSSDTSPSNLALRVIPGEIERTILDIERWEKRLAARASYALLAGGFADVAGPTWFAEKNRLRDAHNRLARLRTEPHRRWANGFSCLCFVLVGAPMAVRLRNSDFLSSFFICFLPILIFYYPLLMLGIGQAKDGAMPPQGVWLANLIMIVIGLVLIRKVLRY